MGTSSAIVGLRKSGRSRFSKALPAPPPQLVDDDQPSSAQSPPPPPPPQQPTFVLPARGDSLPSRPALPPKDPIARKPTPSSSSMAASVYNMTVNSNNNSPLPPLPSLTRVNSPPTSVPKRKPVGSGNSVKSPPASMKSPLPPPPPAPQQPTAAQTEGDISPTESISSLLSAYGTEDSSGNRYSQDTAATKHSFVEPSPPKVLPKDGPSTTSSSALKLDLVSPFSLPTPVSSSKTMMTTNANRQQQQLHSQPLPAVPQQQQQQQQHQGRPPTPPEKDSNSSPQKPPMTPKSTKMALPSPPATDNTSAAGQSPTQPQLWRRRSLKAVKPLTVPELKLTVSHGSTASTQQVATSVINGTFASASTSSSSSSSSSSFASASASRLEPSSLGDTSGESPILNSYQDVSGQSSKPSLPQRSLARGEGSSSSSSSGVMGHKKSKEALDGFSEYAQEIEKGMSDGTYHAPQYSPATMSPEIRRPPTPEYDEEVSPFHDHQQQQQQQQQAFYPQPAASPKSPITPPDDARPLSVIPEFPDQPGEGEASAVAGAAPAAPLPNLLSPRSSSRPRHSPASAPTSASATSSAQSSPELAPTVQPPALVPSPEIRPAAALRASPKLGPTINVVAADDEDVEYHDDNDEDEKGDAPAPVAIMMSEDSPTAPKPGEPAYFPMRRYQFQPVAPGTVLPAAPLKRIQLECFAGHYRLVPSRNEGHPLSCQSCGHRDNGARFTCAHCAVRVCGDCKDVLMMNGRDLGQLVEMLRAA